MEAPASEEVLLELARSLPTTGEVRCSPNTLPPGDVAAAIGRRPQPSDIAGDYCYLALGRAWQDAAPTLLRLAEAVYGGSAEAAEDASSLREQLPGGSTLAVACQTPPAPTGPHVTIRSGLRPIELLPSEGWQFCVKRAVAFTNPKLGKPSQWDAQWFCARWVALEVVWLGDCAAKQRGGWPHIAIASFGFRLPAGGGGASAGLVKRRKHKGQKRHKQRKKKKRERVCADGPGGTERKGKSRR